MADTGFRTTTMRVVRPLNLAPGAHVDPPWLALPQGHGARDVDAITAAEWLHFKENVTDSMRLMPNTSKDKYSGLHAYIAQQNTQTVQDMFTLASPVMIC